MARDRRRVPGRGRWRAFGAMTAGTVLLLLASAAPASAIIVDPDGGGGGSVGCLNSSGGDLGTSLVAPIDGQTVASAPTAGQAVTISWDVVATASDCTSTKLMNPDGSLSLIGFGPTATQGSINVVLPLGTSTWSLVVFATNGKTTLDSLSVTAGPVPKTTPVALARNAGGSLEMFVSSGDDSISARQQVAPGSGYDTVKPGPVSPRKLRSVASETNIDGRVEVFGLDAAGNVFHTAQAFAGSGEWTPWVQMSGTLQSITVARNKDGRLELLGANGQEQVFHRAQKVVGAMPNVSEDTAWEPWQFFDDGGFVHSVAAEANQDGRIELWGVNGAGDPWHRWQTGPNVDSWSPWFYAGGKLSSVAIARNADGRLEVFGTNSLDFVFHRRQLAANIDSWSDWEWYDDGTSLLTNVAAETNADGRIELAGVNRAGTLFHRVQTTPGSAGYSGWEALNRSGKCAIDPSVCSIVATGPPNLQSLQSSVGVFWVEKSVNEDGFIVQKRDSIGDWRTVAVIPSHSTADRGETYSWTDNGHEISGQCYRIQVFNSLVYATSAEKCTVRPDTSVFPKFDGIPTSTVQWTGLSGTNHTTATPLFNQVKDAYLTYEDSLLGVDLDFQGGPSSWKIEAEGGPQLMYGQTVALRGSNGGWLRHGSPTFGVGLDFDYDGPAYEWHIVGSAFAGDPIIDPAKPFALWNHVTHDFLVVPGQTSAGVGVVDLTWNSQWDHIDPTSMAPVGVKTYQLFNCSSERHRLDTWTVDLSVGGWFAKHSPIDPQYGADGCPTAGSQPFKFQLDVNQHHYQVVATDPARAGCNDLDAPYKLECRALTTDLISDTHYLAKMTYLGYLWTDIAGGAPNATLCTRALCGAPPES